MAGSMEQNFDGHVRAIRALGKQHSWFYQLNCRCAQPTEYYLVAGDDGAGGGHPADRAAGCGDELIRVSDNQRALNNLSPASSMARCSCLATASA